MSRLQRVRITRTTPARTAASFVGAARATFLEAGRELVWPDLRDGMIRVGDFGRLTRSVILLGFVLLFAMVGAMLFNAPLREASPLLPMLAAAPGRGELVPLALMPLTLFIFSIAWSFMLSGALHARLVVGLAVLLLYLLMASIWVISSSAVSWVAWAALLGVAIFFFLVRRRAARPALEFGVLLILVSLTFGFSQIYAMQAWRTSGLPGALANLPTMIYTLNILTVPLLLFIGLDIAEFVQRTASWTSRLTYARLGRRALYAALFLFLAWRLGSVALQTGERIGKGSLAEGIASYAGALVIPLGVGVVWWLVGRRGGGQISAEQLVNVAKKAALPLIGAYMGLQVFNIALLLVAGFLGLLFLALGIGGVERMNETLELSGRLVTQEGNWQTLLAGVAVLAAFLFAWRGRRAVALYLGILGTNTLWVQLTNPGRPLDFFGWSGLEPVDFWWVVIFGAVTIFWLVRGRLTEERVRRLFLLLLITFLMRRTQFIEDPFSPFLGFTGVGVVAFGVIWDSIRVGFWANNDSPGLPRVSRIFLYLGYLLFSVAVINWAVASHNILTVDFFTGQAALGGFGIFGKPLIYATFAIALALPATEEPPEQVTGEEVGERRERHS